MLLDAEDLSITGIGMQLIGRSGEKCATGALTTVPPTIPSFLMDGRGVGRTRTTSPTPSDFEDIEVEELRKPTTIISEEEFQEQVTKRVELQLLAQPTDGGLIPVDNIPTSEWAKVPTLYEGIISQWLPKKGPYLVSDKVVLNPEVQGGTALEVRPMIGDDESEQSDVVIEPMKAILPPVESQSQRKPSEPKKPRRMQHMSQRDRRKVQKAVSAARKKEQKAKSEAQNMSKRTDVAPSEEMKAQDAQESDELMLEETAYADPRGRRGAPP